MANTSACFADYRKLFANDPWTSLNVRSKPASTAGKTYTRLEATNTSARFKFYWEDTETNEILKMQSLVEKILSFAPLHRGRLVGFRNFHF